MLGPFFPVAIEVAVAFSQNDADSSNGVSPRRSPPGGLSTIAATREFSGGDMAEKKYFGANFFFFFLSVRSFRCRGWRAPWTPIEGEAPVAEPSPTPATLPVTSGAKDAQHLSLSLPLSSLSISIPLSSSLYFSRFFVLSLLISLHFTTFLHPKYDFVL